MTSLGTWPRGEFQNSSVDVVQKSRGKRVRVLAGTLRLLHSARRSGRGICVAATMSNT